MALTRAAFGRDLGVAQGRVFWVGDGREQGEEPWVRAAALCHSHSCHRGAVQGDCGKAQGHLLQLGEVELKRERVTLQEGRLTAQS